MADTIFCGNPEPAAARKIFPDTSTLLQAIKPSVTGLGLFEPLQEHSARSLPAEIEVYAGSRVQPRDGSTENPDRCQSP
jgi:hypothetical protein